jgi:asparagine synthase (glutamine-hydrolysing)
MTTFAVYVSGEPGRAARKAQEWRRRAGCNVWFDEYCAAITPMYFGGSGHLKGFGSISADPAADSQNGLAELMMEVERAGAGITSTIDVPFATAIWDAPKRTLTVARDALGLNPAYFADDGHGMLFSDDLEWFAHDAVDREFVARFLAVGRLHSERTVWTNVRPVPAGATVCWTAGKVSFHRYWSLDRIDVRPEWTLEAAADEFRRRFTAAVARQIASDQRTWADLSGGQDSAAVVATACALGNTAGTRRRLGGSLTFVDSIGDGDESYFVDAVTTKFGLRNERFRDYSPWLDDGQPPPSVPQPMRDYPYYARDRRASAVLRASGAAYLMSGVGPDYYFPLTAHHAADLLRHGNLRRSGHLIVEWAMARRERVWKTGWERALCPLLPRSVQLMLAARERAAPRWVRPDFIKHFGFGAHYAALRVAAPSRQSVYQGRIAAQMTGLGENLIGWRYSDGVSIRHPFLDRSLVEFCMSLPSTIRSDVHHPKPVMIRGLINTLPRAVARRHTKGFSMLGRIRRTLADPDCVPRRLLKRSILADLGVIEPRTTAAALDGAIARHDDFEATVLYYVLSLETWLSVRFDRFPLMKKGEAA